MGKPILSQFAKDVSLAMKKHSPEILTGIGIAGMVTTTVLAVKATPKAIRLMEEKKEELEVDWLTAVETVKTTWKCYIPAVITGATSVACLIGASSVSLKRNAALATAYKISETALTEYKEKVIETIGEKKERTVREKVAEERIKNDPITNKEIIITKQGETSCYDSISGRYFKSDMEHIKKAEIKLNAQILTGMGGYVSLNDFYDELGLPHIDIGEDLGWNLDNRIELDLSSHIAADGTPCIVVGHTVAPKYGYY